MSRSYIRKRNVILCTWGNKMRCWFVNITNGAREPAFCNIIDNDKFCYKLQS